MASLSLLVLPLSASAQVIAPSCPAPQDGQDGDLQFLKAGGLNSLLTWSTRLLA
jgi:hypothetical protein